MMPDDGDSFWRVECFDTLTSTQDVLKERAANGAREGACVQARVQSGGQGRHGRAWDSPEGNLYLSILLRPDCAVQALGALSLVSGVALSNVLRGLMDDPEPLSLKWPNDVLIARDGGRKKCAGILLSAELDEAGDCDWVVIGLGVNLVVAPDDVGVSLTQIGVSTCLDNFRDLLLDEMLRLYRQWQRDGFDAVRLQWLGLAHPKGQALSVKIGERLESGLFHDIDEHGNLRIEQPDGGLKTISSGDVYVIGD